MEMVAESLVVDDEREDEEYEGSVDWERVWTAEPRTTEESAAWKDALLGHLQGIERSIGELNRGVRVMHASGRYMTMEETKNWRGELIRDKERTIERMRWLKNWWKGSRQREEDRRLWNISERGKRRAQATYDDAMAAIRRIGLLEELYLAVEGYLTDTNDDAAWQSLNDAFDAFERSWPSVNEDDET